MKKMKNNTVLRQILAICKDALLFISKGILMLAISLLYLIGAMIFELVDKDVKASVKVAIVILFLLLLFPLGMVSGILPAIMKIATMIIRRIILSLVSKNISRDTGWKTWRLAHLGKNMTAEELEDSIGNSKIFLQSALLLLSWL